MRYMINRANLLYDSIKRNIQFFFSREKLPKVTKEIVVNLSYKCTLGCKYCYAKDISKFIDKDMKFSDFKQLLNWIKKRKLKFFFLGGEPTEYPQFEEILKMCIKKKVPFRVGSNLLCNEKILRLIVKYSTGSNVINYNSIHNYNKKQLKIFKFNLQKMKNVQKIFYYNVQKTDTQANINRLIKAAKEYEAIIALCLTVPHSLDIDYEMKIIFDIINQAEENGVNCMIFRPLPKCKISKKMLKKIKLATNRYDTYSICDMGPIVVNPDLTVFPCVSLNSKEINGPSILDFKNIRSVHDYYSKEIKRLVRIPLDKKCIKCKFRIDKTCQGGCLVNKLD